MDNNGTVQNFSWPMRAKIEKVKGFERWAQAGLEFWVESSRAAR